MGRVEVGPQLAVEEQLLADGAHHAHHVVPGLLQAEREMHVESDGNHQVDLRQKK